MFQIYLCMVCFIARIPLGILGICFWNWVYCIFWRFCVWLYVWRYLLIAFVYIIDFLTWSCRSSNNNFDQYFDIVVFLPRISCRFLFRMNAIIESSVKLCSKSLFIFNRSQCLFTALFMSVLVLAEFCLMLLNFSGLVDKPFQS